jgi:hypothetical protein
VGSLAFITVGIITICLFFLYDKTQRTYIFSLKNCIDEQNKVINRQQSMIDTLFQEES